MTGYGPINKTLYDRNCVQSADCLVCLGVAESVEHMLFHCPLYNGFRREYYEALAADDNWSNLLDDMDKFITFNDYAFNVFTTRKEYLATLDSDSPPPRGRDGQRLI